MENTQHRVTPLTVYKASAGSGKTFTLAVEYIKLLIDNPLAFENTLAVTFTNKATEEMKSRILTQLYGISLQLPDSKDYTEKICSDLGISREHCAKQAKVALRLLLHNYNFFRVQTIDTFFQGVMRNLAKELNLSNNLRVSLNDDQVLGQAVDSLMETLDGNKQLMDWVWDYVSENMDNDKSWSIDEEIKKFGKNITKEFYKSNKGKLKDAFKKENFFRDFKKELTSIKTSIEQKYLKIGQKALDIMSDNSLTAGDFYQSTKGIYSYWVKLKSGNFIDKDKSPIINNYAQKSIDGGPEAWLGKKVINKDAALDVVTNQLLPLLRETEATRKQDARQYNSAVLTLNNMNRLRLLHSIEEEIKRENGEHSRFLLSDTQTLLYDMIKGDERIAPFIFEKIGSYIKHIMIDEFQDTSNVQWKNFKTLLSNCMSEPSFDGNDERKITNNLIVGDVKQSIYRFRSGDWRLLNDIDYEFNEKQLDTKSLQTNYRSERNIIEFNNLFFKIAAGIEADKLMPDNEDAARTFIQQHDLSPNLIVKRTQWAQALRKAYSDVAQQVPVFRDKKGFVKVQLMTPEPDQKDNDILTALLENIYDLLDKGVSQKDIAILVRTKKNIPLIADYFAQNAKHIKLISQEAYRLDSSIAVKMIILGMQLITKPNDIKIKAELARLYDKSINQDEEKQNNSIFLNRELTFKLLPKELVTEEQLRQLSTLPLYELAESLVRILNINKVEGQAIYVSTFFDKLNAYAEDNIADVNEFLKFWDSDLCSKTVEIGNVDGIRIMSIHKSKGLEFDHVLMPFCNWNLGSPFPSTLWCEVEDEPFKQLPFIPVEYMNENSLKNSIYEMTGYEESMQEMVDNLNLLYVAFTRAGKSLYVIGERKSSRSEGRAKLIDLTFQQIANYTEGDKLEDFTIEGSDDSDGPLTFTFGEFTLKEKKDKHSDNVFCAPVSTVDVHIDSYQNPSVCFRQSNKSREFAEDAVDENDSKRYIRMGTVLHQLFSSIHTFDDVNTVLANMEFEGLLYDEDLTQEKLRENLRKKFSNPQVKDWFSPRWQVFNECSILSLDENGKLVEKRPDRVITDGAKTIVIDYKFGNHHDEYTAQVQDYIERLSAMGYTNVEGYLWFVNKNEIVKVESKVPAINS